MFNSNAIVPVSLVIDTRSEEQLNAYMNLLRAIGRTSETSEEQEPESESGQEQETTPRQKRQYTRRKKVEETPAPTEEQEEHEQEEPASPANGEPAAPAPAPTPAKPAEKEETMYSIEDVRKLLAQKVITHRDEIKSKLSDLGAPNVSSLKPDLYPEMVTFLNSLD